MRTEDSLEQSLRRVLKAAGYMMRKSHAPLQGSGKSISRFGNTGKAVRNFQRGETAS